MRFKSLIVLISLFVSLPFATAKSKSLAQITVGDLKNLTYTVDGESVKLYIFTIVPLDQVGIGGYFYEPTAAVVLTKNDPAGITKYYLAIVIRDEDDSKIKQAAVTYLGDKKISSLCTRWWNILVQVETGPDSYYEVETFRFQDRVLWKAIKQ